MQKMYKFLIMSLIIFSLQGCGGATPSSNNYGYSMAVKAEEYKNNNNFSEAKYYLEEASKSNNSTASVWANGILGYMYLYSLGVTQNYSKAKQYLKKSSDGGDINAKNNLGSMYLNGYGVTQNYSKAKQLFEEASNAGNIFAKANLGSMYLYGNGVTQNYTKAKQLLEEASNAGNMFAKANLGSMYLYGKGVTQNYSKAKQLSEEASAAGQIFAKFNLGFMYLQGKGVTKDYTKAKQLLEEASASGNMFAKSYLGFMYLYGKGITKNYSKAKQLCEEASDSGNIVANLLLGKMYLYGNGVTKNYSKAEQYFEKSNSYVGQGWMYYTEASIRDYKKAKYYFEKGIDNGGTAEKNNLGLMYFRGQGVTKNYKKAKELFQEAINKDLEYSKNNLAWLYLNGYGVTQNTDKALKLFEEASDEDNIASNLNLAWIYKNGISVKKDERKAKYWQDRADSLGEDILEENYELTYTFDAPFISDNLAILLKTTKQRNINNKRFLIVIGAENYAYTDNIVYSRHTAQMFTKVAQKTLGISKSNTLELTSKNASMGRIQMKMQKLLRRVKNGDTIYFYYSGHGIPVVSQNNEPYILPIDVEPEFISEAPFFKLKNIYKTLGDSKASKVVAFVDSCFSGATDGVSVIKGVAATRLKPKNITFDKKKMVVITAGKDKQYSNMYEEKGYRLFSYYLMESMLKGRTNLKDIYNELYLNVKDKSYEMGDMKLQEPTFSGNKAMKL